MRLGFKVNYMLKSIKFGGSSLGNAQSILKCRDIITQQLNNGHIIVVTTSAMFNVTNKLFEIVDNIAEKDQLTALMNIKYLHNLHKTTVQAICPNNGAKQVWKREFAIFFEQLEAIARGLSVVGGYNDLITAKICSYGDKLAAKLIQTALEAPIVIDSEQIIKTGSDNYLNATVDFEKTIPLCQKFLTPLLDQYKIVIGNGYSGSDQNQTTTLL